MYFLRDIPKIFQASEKCKTELEDFLTQIPANLLPSHYEEIDTLITEMDTIDGYHNRLMIQLFAGSEKTHAVEWEKRGSKKHITDYYYLSITDSQVEMHTQKLDHSTSQLLKKRVVYQTTETGFVRRMITIQENHHHFLPEIELNKERTNYVGTDQDVMAIDYCLKQKKYQDLMDEKYHSHQLSYQRQADNPLLVSVLTDEESFVSENSQKEFSSLKVLRQNQVTIVENTSKNKKLEKKKG